MSERAQIAWEGQWLKALTRGPWEWVSRTRGIEAAVILAEHEGRIILVEEYREAAGIRMIGLPAGLVGDEGDDATIETTAIKELEEEAGFTGDGVERLGTFYTSPGLTDEQFTLVRVSGVRPIERDIEEGFAVHLIAREEMADFIAKKRAEGIGMDVKMLLFLSGAFGL